MLQGDIIAARPQFLASCCRKLIFVMFRFTLNFNAHRLAISVGGKRFSGILIEHRSRPSWDVDQRKHSSGVR